MPSPPLITLLTDFGIANHYVAAMKGVILGICPEARVVDISHEIEPFDVAEAAFTLSQAYPYFPAGSVHVVVVDPGVGSARLPLAVEADGKIFIGPDNGVFSFPFQKDPRHTVRQIAASRYFRHPVSRTFHGRDIFGPVAAHVAAGLRVEEVGPVVAEVVRLGIADPPREEGGYWKGQILHSDRFGNLVTNFRVSDFPEMARNRFEMVIGGTVTSRYSTTYAGVSEGDILVIPGSGGYLEVSINQGDASRKTGVSTGSPVKLRFMGPQYQGADSTDGV